MGKGNYYLNWTRAALGFALIAFTAGVMTACTQPGGYIDPSFYGENPSGQQNPNNNQNANISAPAGFDYYQLYSSVTSVKVQIKRVAVRTQDGRIIELPETNTILDLMKVGTTDGIGVKMPGTGSETIVEVIMRIKDEGHNEVLYSDGRSCKLKTHGELTFYARNALVLERGVPYKVHATFDPLNGLNLGCGDSNAHVLSVASNGDAVITPFCNDTNEKNCQLRCGLANSRYEVSGVDFDESSPDPTPTPAPDDNNL